MTITSIMWNSSFLLACLAFAFCDAASLSTTTMNPWDDFVDEFFYMAFDNMSSITLPDVSYTFSKKLLDINWAGKIELSGGLLGNFTSLKRARPIVTKNVQPSGALKLSAALTMGNLIIGFSKFYFHFLGVTVNDCLILSCTDNEISFQLTWFNDDKGNCSLTVDKIDIDNLEMFHLHILPSSVVDTIESWAGTLILDVIAPIVRIEFNNQLLPFVNKEIQKMDICSLLPY